MKKTFVIVASTALILFTTIACASAPSVQPMETARENDVFTATRARPVLAILPFYGGTAGEGETIASLFSHQPALLEVFSVVTRTSAAMEALLIGHGARLTDITDSDAIANIGRLLNADYVLSGSIRRLGDRNLLIATIINVETFEQVAGSYQAYRILGEVPGFLPAMSRDMVNTTLGRGIARRENLAIIPFSRHPGISAHDAYTLTQILAIELIATGRYAILPRTTVIQAAQAEQGFQAGGSGEGMAAVGRAANADLVLNGEISMLGATNLFAAQILRVVDGSVVIGNSRSFQVIADGINLMPEMAILLTERDPAIQEERIAALRDLERRAQEAAAAEAEEARRQREAVEAEARRALAEETRRAQRAEATQARRANAVRNEIEGLSFSYLWGEGNEGSLSGFSFGLFLSGVYWSPFPFINIGIETRIKALSENNFFAGEAPNFGWYFSISPTLGVLYPLGPGARIFLNALIDLGRLPERGLIHNWAISENFAMGLTPGLNAGLSLGRGGTFTIKYRGVWYEGAFLSSVGIGIGRLR